VKVFCFVKFVAGFSSINIGKDKDDDDDDGYLCLAAVYI
jgi:hypothetical protein